MSDLTPNLLLPYIVPDQAQKHVTHNESLQHLDALCQLVLIDQLTAPPASPAEGACYAIAANATAAWTGLSGKVAQFIDGDWVYLQPRAGWLAWMVAQSALHWFDGTAWQQAPGAANSSFQTVGINATADTTNRLALASPASLFNHVGAGHQLKVNRAADAATGSVLFQTGFSGRAEFGMLGDSNFSLKVSPNGTTWKTALAIDSAGVPRFSGKPVCRTSLNAAALSPAAASFTGFQLLAINQGGFALGAAVSPGTGSRLVVPASGFYQISVNGVALSSAGHTMTLLQNGTTALGTLRGTASTINASLGFTTFATLAAGDTLHFQHAGTAQIDFGPGKTELMLALL
nr:DUF2793 domain-containing protein [uncultured Gellertiella sp.]